MLSIRPARGGLCESSRANRAVFGNGDVAIKKGFKLREAKQQFPCCFEAEVSERGVLGE